MRLGYNSNGFPQHRLPEMLDVLAEIGYEAVALTPDVGRLDPFAPRAEETRSVKAALAEHGLAVAVETGARFVLDPRRKHQPTLLAAPQQAERRLDMLRRCLDLAVELGAETLSFWAGCPEDGLPADGPTVARHASARPARASSLGFDALLERLCAGTARLLDAARGSGVTVCFEPEPGMLVASQDELDAFLARLQRPELCVMLDVGHVPVSDGVPPEHVLRRLGPRLGGLQLDDTDGRVHEHLLPGEGVVDFARVFAAARDVGFGGLACVELPRHGHDPVATARRVHGVLRAAAGDAR